MYFDKKVCVLGLGYIGLPTASFLGTKGYTVFGVDVKQEVVDTINKGEIHIVEPDLDILVKSAVNSGQLTASLEPQPADIFIIAVPTPFKEGNEPDLRFVESATKSILPHLTKGNLIILESTSPVGTTDDIVAKLVCDAGFLIDEDVFIAHSPERVLPGRVLAELVENDRVVGGVSERSTQAAIDFYESFVQGEVLATDAKTAEMAKLTENSFRDVNIAIANELSVICDKLNIDVWELIDLANRHPRVNILKPGPGVGGHCIAVDPWFIISAAKEEAKLLRSAREINDHKPHWVINKITEKANKFKHPTIGCLGLAFKADVDDLRESPAFEIAKELSNSSDWTVLVAEPNISEHKDFDILNYMEVIRRSDIVVVLVDHKQFKKLKRSDLNEKVLIDTRGIIR